MRYPEYRGMPLPARSDREHLKALLDWLLRAQSVTDSGGVSAGYYLYSGEWGPAYRETTGYIIPTVLNYAELTGEGAYRDKALLMADWELDVQLPEGPFGEVQDDGQVLPKIFNTGQVIFGLSAAYQITGAQKYLDALVRAADWLVARQEPGGEWSNFTTQGPKTYHARVDWALLDAFRLTGKLAYRESAANNLQWVLEQQASNGWFEHTSLTAPDKPWTHLLGYTLRGLLESAIMLDDPIRQRILEGLQRAIPPLRKLVEDQQENRKFPYLPCTLDPRWESEDDHTCLTGNAQLSIVFFRAADAFKDPELRVTASLMVEQLKGLHLPESQKPFLRGGLTGSYPVNQGYCAGMLINWAAKFFADALLLKIGSPLKYRG
ncbi:terpene cyclase/mutase family protein [bacterium]|nr:terpene cyclase/mutase family protein [bacterium]